MHGGLLEVGLVADLGPVHLLEQAFVATAAQIRALDFDHVPGDFLGLDHGLDLGLFTVVFHRHHLGAGLFKGLEIGLLLGGTVGAAEVHHGELALGESGQAGHHGHGQQDGFEFHGEDLLG